MPFPIGGALGTANSELGNIILAYGAQQSQALQVVYGGVRPDEIGAYDIALGFRNPATGVVQMVGYVLTPSSQFAQGTDIQDEDHLVQIASPLSTDRYGRFPKVSQGDWSGGERQLIFVNGNQYYQSQQVDGSKPGHLTVLGSYTAVTTPAAIQHGDPRSISSDALRWYVVEQGSPTPVATVTFTGTVTALATVTGTVSELVRAPDAVYAYSTTGVWKLSTSGAHTQVVNEAPPNNQTCCLGYFGGNLYYATGNIATEVLKHATYPFPGAGVGVTDRTVLQMEGAITGVGDGPTGVVFTAGEALSGPATPSPWTWVYVWDGANATLIGRIFGGVNDICEANGVVYILCSILPGATGTTMPIIYSVSGSTISVFDDYRWLDPNFQPATTTPLSQGHLDSDGTWLYLWWPTLNTKRYKLSSGAISDCGAPQAQGTLYHIGAVGATLPGSGILDCDPAGAGTTAYIVKFGDIPNVNGQLISSYYDFGTPNVDKQFQSVEFQMNSALNTQAITVEAQVDGIGYVQLPVQLSPSNNTLLCLFPSRSIGHRARLRVTLNGSYNPDISQWSILAALARTWKLTVSCRHDPQIRGTPGPMADPQGLTAQQLVANIEAAYHQAGGYVTLFIPDPNAAGGGTIMTTGGSYTIPKGVSVVNAQLQDYTRRNAAGVSPTFHQMQDGGALDLEADCDLVLSEVL